MDGTNDALQFIAFDLETTGLSARFDRIVEVGAVCFDLTGRVLDTFQSLVDPERTMPPAARAVHGLGDAELRGQPTAAAVLPAFCEWLAHFSAAELVAHNAAFDAGFLGCELARAGMVCPDRALIDTVPVARKLWPGLPNHRLATLANHFAWNLDQNHRALGDSRRVMALWLAAWESARAGIPLVRYPITVRATATFIPLGFEWLADAVRSGATVELIYDGGSAACEPRQITPLALERAGGNAYLVALCHRDRIQKRFRFDRILRAERPSAPGRPGLNANTPVTNVLPF